MDARVQAIRQDYMVGNGSCSSIDTCWSDKELIELFNSAKISTPEAALAWALEHEGMHLEQGLNMRWGDSDDA